MHFRHTNTRKRAYIVEFLNIALGDVYNQNYAVFVYRAQGTYTVCWLQMLFSPLRGVQTALPHIPYLDFMGHFAARKREGKREGRKGAEGMRKKTPT